MKLQTKPYLFAQIACSEANMEQRYSYTKNLVQVIQLSLSKFYSIRVVSSTFEGSLDSYRSAQRDPSSRIPGKPDVEAFFPSEHLLKLTNLLISWK